MQLENIFPNHTTEEEWNELARLASIMLTAISASLQERAEGSAASVRKCEHNDE